METDGTGRRRRWWVFGLVGVAVLCLAGVVGVVLAYPPVAATFCPGCYGLRQLEPGVYAEPDLSAGERRQLTDAVTEADRRIRAYYGGRLTSPRTLACLTDDCYRRIGGGRERGVAVLDWAVMLSPRGVSPVIAAHEMSHVELHHRLGGAEVPQWFDEGLAVLVSDDRRYLRPVGAPDRCRQEPDGELPASLRDWLRAAGTDRQTYARAACEVSRWQDANGGPEAVRDLILRLRAGEDFDAIVRG